MKKNFLFSIVILMLFSCFFTPKLNASNNNIETNTNITTNKNDTKELENNKKIISKEEIIKSIDTSKKENDFEIDNLTQVKLYNVGKTKDNQIIKTSMPSELLIEYYQDKDKFRANYPQSGYEIKWESDSTYGTPIIKIGNEYVFCNDAYKEFPYGDEYDNGTIRGDLNSSIGAIHQHGFPYFISGRPWNTSNEQTYVGEFVAINTIRGVFNRKNIERRNNAYVNYLLAQASNGNFKPNANNILEIHQPQNIHTHYNPQTKRIESDLYFLRASQPFKVTNLPPQLSVVNEGGAPQDYYGSDARFRIVSDMITYKGDIVFNIESTFCAYNTLIYTPKNSKKQPISKLTTNPLPVTHKAQVNMRPAIIDFVGRKTKENNEPLANARFGLFRKNGELVHEGISAADGTFRMPGCDVNEFICNDNAYVEEIHTPDNNIYEMQRTRFYFPAANSENFKNAITGSAYQIHSGQSINNHFIRGKSFLLRKIDEDTKKPLKGAKFIIERLSGDINDPIDKPFKVEKETDENGFIGFDESLMSKYLYGKYIVHEIKAPDGYQINKQIFPFEITAGINQIDFTVTNKKKEIEIVGSKINEDNENIENTTFALYKEDKDNKTNKISECKTDKDGLFEFKNIKFDLLETDGKVFVQEEKTSDDNKYEKEDTKYEIPKLMKNMSQYEQTDEKLIYKIKPKEKIKNKYLRAKSFQLQKVDSKTKEPLKNAVFKIQRLSGSKDKNIDKPFSIELTSNEKGLITVDKDIIDKFLYGNYTVTEIKAPDGYIIKNDEMNFTIDKEIKDIKLVCENDKQEIIPPEKTTDLIETGFSQNEYLLYVISILFVLLILSFIKGGKEEDER